MAEQQTSILIVGGGAAGVSVANNLRRKNKALDITLVEPSEKHYYQPGFTIVGGGAYTLKQATRNQVDLIHSSIKWVKEYAVSFQPDQNQITLQSGQILDYDYLVVCPGLQIDFDKIEGLSDTLGKNGVCCNYSVDHVEYTWEILQNLSSGRALFTQPSMPIKCAGAPQKIMYLAADRFRQQGTSEQVDVQFFNAGPAMFGIPFFAKALSKVVQDYGIKTNFGANLVAVNGETKQATFEISDAEGNKSKRVEDFDMLHVTPPQSAPDFIKKSPLANESGWIDVNHFTLQHNQFDNIFGLGDAAATPNAKTAAAVRKQVPVVVKNILKLLKHQTVVEDYDGYGSCPLTTSKGTVMLAEFSYGGKVTPSFPFLDPRSNSRLWWIGKLIGFPWLYWQVMIKGYDFDIPHKATYAEKLVDKDT